MELAEVLAIRARLSSLGSVKTTLDQATSSATDEQFIDPAGRFAIRLVSTFGEDPIFPQSGEGEPRCVHMKIPPPTRF